LPQWSLLLSDGVLPNFLDTHGYFFEPQWSPLLTSGSAKGGLDQWVGQAAAAMEPAGGGRWDEVPGAGDVSEQSRAAMESAGYQRERPVQIVLDEDTKEP
jgi:hypothetical protein